jgi:hypothetical protein
VTTEFREVSLALRVRFAEKEVRAPCAGGPVP